MDGGYLSEYAEDFIELKHRFITILQEERDLLEIVSLVGREVLSEEQKMILGIEKVIREDFIEQNVYSSYDYMCLCCKSLGVMRSIFPYIASPISL